MRGDLLFFLNLFSRKKTDDRKSKVKREGRACNWPSFSGMKGPHGHAGLERPIKEGGLRAVSTA
jgi:hypothetical protein